MRRFLRRLRACETGAGTVEYALLIAVIALGLLGILALFRNAVGDATDQAAMSVSKRAGGGYGVTVAASGARGGGIAHGPKAGPPDSASTNPDSSAASGGTAVATSYPVKP